jgi:hypothetical protein
MVQLVVSVAFLVLIHLGDPIFIRNPYKCEHWIFPSWIGGVGPSLKKNFFNVTEVQDETILIMFSLILVTTTPAT